MYLIMVWSARRVLESIVGILAVVTVLLDAQDANVMINKIERIRKERDMSDFFMSCKSKKYLYIQLYDKMYDLTSSKNGFGINFSLD
tara:strand:+ start:3720 stop:3980 length:261 start_codon:yes stop_codon:yes gene_type:complete